MKDTWLCDVPPEAQWHKWHTYFIQSHLSAPTVYVLPDRKHKSKCDCFGSKCSLNIAQDTCSQFPVCWLQKDTSFQGIALSPKHTFYNTEEGLYSPKRMNLWRNPKWHLTPPPAPPSGKQIANFSKRSRSKFRSNWP